RNFQRTGAKDAAVRAESIRYIFAQLDLERLHAPGVTVDEQHCDLADGESIRCNHGSSMEILVRQAHHHLLFTAVAASVEPMWGDTPLRRRVQMKHCVDARGYRVEPRSLLVRQEDTVGHQ